LVVQEPAVDSSGPTKDGSTSGSTETADPKLAVIIPELTSDCSESPPTPQPLRDRSESSFEMPRDGSESPPAVDNPVVSPTEWSGKRRQTVNLQLCPPVKFDIHEPNKIGYDRKEDLYRFVQENW
jgi:hypothetical protein